MANHLRELAERPPLTPAVLETPSTRADGTSGRRLDDVQLGWLPACAS